MAHPDELRRNRSATLKDVAREARVSYSTVSRALNGLEVVRPETRERVLEAARRLGYVANPQARSLAVGRTRLIGLLSPAIDTPYIGQIYGGVDEELSRAGYDLVLFVTRSRRARETSYMTILRKGRLVDGLLLLLPLDAEGDSQMLLSERLPYVVIDHHGFDTVSTTVTAANRQGARRAAEHLLELGHRRVAFITGTPSLSSAAERLEGYREALAAAGVPFDPDLVATGDFSHEGGVRAAHALLDLPRPPTAVFAANDVSALGAVEAVRARGLSVPEDVSVVGFDDVPLAARAYPALTTVRQPLEEMGRAAARMLLRLLEGSDAPVASAVLPTELVVRSSCRPPRSPREPAPGRSPA